MKDLTISMSGYWIGRLNEYAKKVGKTVDRVVFDLLSDKLIEIDLMLGEEGK